MIVWRRPEEFRAACDAARAAGKRVGLVPTMGALHPGHLALVEEAARHASFVVVSIFVNPTQFGPTEDLARYPRTFEADRAACERAGVAGIFHPEVAAMYPPGDETRVRVGQTAAPLCGVHRPGHFEGVATVVAKLLSLTGPSVAVFGRKDYQQVAVVRRMVADLFLPAQIVALPTVREADGVAMSSRNAYLSSEQRAAARAIPRGLSSASQAFARGARRAGTLTGLVRAELAAAERPEVPVSIDYVEAADPSTVQPLGEDDTLGDRALLAVAVRLGGARLIDNIVLGEDPAPIQEGA